MPPQDEAPEVPLDGAEDVGLHYAVTGPRDDAHKDWMVVARFVDCLDALQFAAKMMDARVYRNEKIYKRRVAGIWLRDAKKSE